ncbi:cilia- and flagella-associated protein 337-like [Pelodytes ibericus]
MSAEPCVHTVSWSLAVGVRMSRTFGLSKTALKALINKSASSKTGEFFSMSGDAQANASPLSKLIMNAISDVGRAVRPHCFGRRMEKRHGDCLSACGCPEPSVGPSEDTTFQQTQSSKRDLFHLPAIVTETPHREPFIQICPMPDSSLLGVGQDGLISVWTSDLKLKKSRFILDENKQQNRKVKWTADATLIPQYNKLIIGTCDREIRFYELSNFEPYCQIVGLDTMPLHLGYSLRDTDECVIYFGDEQGCVNILLISQVADTLRSWTKCQVLDEIPSVNIDNIEETGHVKYIRWKVHNDWVTQIRYVHSIESIISSSNDDFTALVIGCVEGTRNVQQRLRDLMDTSSTHSRRTMLAMNIPPKRNINDESLFRVKRGVKTFDFCKESNILVTGGLDRIVRMWNPYVPGWPTGLLRGHTSPISFLCIGDDNTKIYSVSTDCTVMVWDIEDHTCLINVISKASQIRGEIATCYFSSHLRALYIATDSLAVLQLQESSVQPGLPSVSHSEPVSCCHYNQNFQQVISCSAGSVIKTWDLLTGQLVCEVRGAHGSCPITCLAVDYTGNRMVTGGKDGSLKQWNRTSNSVTYTKTLAQGRSASSKDEISDCSYVVLHNIRYILSVRRDRKICIIPDQVDAVISEDEYPQYSLINNLRKEYEEGKFCMASLPPNLVAVSSYNGEIILWNLQSGHILCHLNASGCEELENGTGSADDLIINKVYFIHSRIERKYKSAVLVASGPRGQITFWNISDGGSIFGRFAGSHHKSVVNDLGISEDGSLLCAADRMHYVYIWDISQYALHGPETKPPTLLHCWRAHKCDITRVIPVIKHRLIITSSLDCTMKLWSVEGEHIGTFGQSTPWYLKGTAFWKAQQCDTNVSSQDQSLSSESGTNQSLGCEEEVGKQNMVSEVIGTLISVNYKDIAEELKKINTSNSKTRVKNVGPKQMDIQQTCGRLNAYKSLQICDLTSVSTTIRKPNPAAELNDPFDLAF